MAVRVRRLVAIATITSYYHKLYALDTVLPRLQIPDKAHLTAAMRGHILAEATLIGGYRRSGKDNINAARLRQSPVRGGSLR